MLRCSITSRCVKNPKEMPTNLVGTIIEVHSVLVQRASPLFSADNSSLVGLQTISMDVYSKLSRDNIKLLRTYGDVLMDLVCKDACDGEFVSSHFVLKDTRTILWSFISRA